jgi:hypothetical protein
MPPRAKENSNDKDISLLEKGNTAWIIIYAFIAVNQDIKP